MLKFSEQYNEWSKLIISNSIEKMVSEVRSQLKSKDLTKIEKGRERILGALDKSLKSDINEATKLYLINDLYAKQVEKGKHNQVPSKENEEYLKKYILDKTGEEILFPNLKKHEDRKFATINYRGTIINYKLVNIINRYDNNYVRDFVNYYIANPSNDDLIFLIDGLETDKFREEMVEEVKNGKLQHLKLEVKNVEEFIEWIEKN